MSSSEMKLDDRTVADAPGGAGSDWVVEFDQERVEVDKPESVSSEKGRRRGTQNTRGASVSLDLQDLGKLVVQTLPGGPGPGFAPEKGEARASQATQILPASKETEIQPSDDDSKGDEVDNDQTQMETQDMVPGAFGKSERVEGFKLNPGTKVHKYELVRLIGKGGMGTVWAAHDTKLGRKVAIKFLHKKAGRKKEFRERFLAEARATAQFNHENIVIIHDAGEYSGLSYLVLEYLEGESLAERLEGRTMPYVQAIQTMIPVVRALAEAHALGIVHRDLKPANIFVSSAGNIKVLDFGLAKLFAGEDPASTQAKPSLEALQKHLERSELQDEDSQVSGVSSMGTSALTATTGRGQLHDSETDLTEVGAIMGTYSFMSPEQWGLGSIDHLTDLWAVGIILFRMMSGEHPFGAKTTNNIMANIMRRDEPVRSIRELVPEVPEDVAELISSCLEKTKENRIASADELLSILEGLAAASGRVKLAADQSPYLGLAAFTEKDANRFFGRDDEIAQFIGKLKDWPTLAVVGPSGAGKSSFVRAGVIPTLRSSDAADWDVIICRPGRDPFASISGAIHAAHTTSEADLAKNLRREPGHLGAVLRARARANGRPLMVYVDQFEELYTMVEDADTRERFATALASVAVDATTPVRVTLSMRSDFLDRVVECPELMSAISHELTVLRQPGADGLRDALVQPASMAGFAFESDDTLDEMINSLATETAALPLLQFAAQKLWEARDKKQKLLTRQAYKDMGGVEGALVRHADLVVQSMSRQDRAATKLLFQRLVTPESTRAILARGELSSLFDDAKVAERILGVLTEARLLTVQTTSDDEADARVEIVHESLIVRWQTLKRWLDEGHEDRAMLDQLRQASGQWQLRKRPSGLLWTGEAIDEARLWRRRSKAKMTPVEEAFLAEGFRLADRAQRRRRIGVTAIIIILAAVALGALGSMVKIRESGQRAQRESERAKKEQTRAVNEAKKARAAETEAKRNLMTAVRATNEARAATTKEKKAKALATKRFDQYKTSVAREEMTQGELRQSYKDLQKALKRAQKSQLGAEKANARAQRETTRAQTLARDLKRRLAAERAENRRLRKMRVKLIQSLPVGMRPRSR
jgi:eukaryotic-like serine/threonine-protein kinase